MSITSGRRAWLFVKGPQSVRIVIDGASIGVYGPGPQFSHTTFDDAMDATLQQAVVEQALVVDGWTLEQLTTERRCTPNPRPPGPVERRASLRLVRTSED